VSGTDPAARQTALGLTASDDDRYWNAELVEAMFRDGLWTIMEDLVAFESHIVHPVEVDFVESLRRNTNVGLRRLEGQRSRRSEPAFTIGDSMKTGSPRWDSPR
jgi:hypothetical protein